MSLKSTQNGGPCCHFRTRNSDAAQIHPFPSLKVTGTKNLDTQHINVGEGTVSGPKIASLGA